MFQIGHIEVDLSVEGDDGGIQESAVAVRDRPPG